MTTATHTPADDGAGAPPAATDRPDLSVPEPAEVFERLFGQYARPLYRYLVQRVGAQAGDDLVAETFLTALQQRHSYDPDRAAVRSWLYGIATNLVRQHLRQQARALDANARVVATTRTDLETHEGRVVDRVDAQRRAQQLAAALDLLNPDDRDVLLLTSWGGLDSNEVADALGIPAGTVRSRLHRVRRWLRSNIDQAARPGDGGKGSDE